MTRKARLKHHYGLTPEDFDRMMLEQGGTCAICEQPFANKPYEPHIDHCHETGEVRGLLCSPCNVALGRFEREKWPEKAQMYLGYQ